MAKRLCELSKNMNQSRKGRKKERTYIMREKKAKLFSQEDIGKTEFQVLKVKHIIMQMLRYKLPFT